MQIEKPDSFDATEERTDISNENDPVPSSETALPGMLIDALARLPDRAILDEARLASILGVTRRTVRRMVSRFELPPPVRLAGRSTWFAGRILAHIEAAAKRSERDAERRSRTIRDLTP